MEYYSRRCSFRCGKQGKLRDPKVLDDTVRGMLNNTRAVALADNFAAQWLGLRGLSDVEPDKQTYPEFDTALAAAFHSETRMFVRSLLRENRSILACSAPTTPISTNDLPTFTEFLA